MTRNQLTYMELVETNRSNLAREAEQRRSNMANEFENYRSNVAREFETFRHNVSVENETNRHNLETERLGFATLAETNRSNLANESIRLGQNQLTSAANEEQKRSNLAREALTAEQNKIASSNARIGAINAATNWFNAQTSRQVANTGVLQQQETARHNLSTEILGFSNLAETARQNDLMFLINQQRNDETQRHNYASESAESNRIAVQSRQVDNQLYRDRIDLATQISKLDEIRRHNMALESYEQPESRSRIFQNYSRGFESIMSTLKQITQTMSAATNLNF